MPLKGFLKKKDKGHEEGGGGGGLDGFLSPNTPGFTFVRTTTSTQEIIVPPDFPGDQNLSPRSAEYRRSHNPFRRHSHTPSPTPSISQSDDGRSSSNRLSRLHIGRRRSGSSANVPSDLPEIALASTEEDEARWEKRATMLAQSNPLNASGRSSANISLSGDGVGASAGADAGSRPRSSRSVGVGVGDAGGDINIQEAIRLHEAGELAESTTMFGQLADPNGANNALSQVLYGLALRHGWGCDPNPELAITYLSYAASNSAEVESLALQAGMKKGGAAKGELVLAIFELANCFRQGWGVKKDPVAAKQYYETAANLGDTDAMNEVAWCYLEGFGCKKDKFKAAQYLRLAEEKGSKIIGNSWIWKEKYNPKPMGSKK